MDERTFCSQFVAGLNHQGFVAYRYPDLARGLIKPCDIIACTPDGKYWAIEGKMARVSHFSPKAVVLSENMFRSHQLPSLQRVRDKGAHASIVLGVLPPEAHKLRAWILPLSFIRKRFVAGEKLRLADLEERSFYAEMARIPGVGWGLPPSWLESDLLPMEDSTDEATRE